MHLEALRLVHPVPPQPQTPASQPRGELKRRHKFEENVNKEINDDKIFAYEKIMNVQKSIAKKRNIPILSEEERHNVALVTSEHKHLNNIDGKDDSQMIELIPN